MKDHANVKREDKSMSIIYKGGSSMIGRQRTGFNLTR